MVIEILEKRNKKIFPSAQRSPQRWLAIARVRWRWQAGPRGLRREVRERLPCPWLLSLLKWFRRVGGPGFLPVARSLFASEFYFVLLPIIVRRRHCVTEISGRRNWLGLGTLRPLTPFFHFFTVVVSPFYRRNCQRSFNGRAPLS